nr:immunoglobulin heavy chain junction region [Macaca mulatta]MOV55716.1 immunoglobulin heavy chain junction region [Macaca mulatta]MOV56173.1 immunoglobulin heavy chain junction region [Macaca mulatta]MOV56229.1 immunoglobulin heavy chain junction region [Macaca mulatta]MOV56831.1 immunoglobulin heavy chain junction region [Macaca mulatta]
CARGLTGDQFRFDVW